ncbi:hypothetical protein J2S43_003178 [Catenuloplanes nepalensis]|uniref:Uncharacterized protein n=1 Tax=Catenuloplanes nepalensis TaxID=587533 RepID=A0ABT9MT99_9ACTN|nr:hypothetical protein [Catenuloplanes nepalensis]MDP9794666.1 hypothetical protein [Catenuloplanes nepalensis]
MTGPVVIVGGAAGLAIADALRASRPGGGAARAARVVAPREPPG